MVYEYRGKGGTKNKEVEREKKKKKIDRGNRVKLGRIYVRAGIAAQEPTRHADRRTHRSHPSLPDLPLADAQST
jgi:hypothetical protein